VGIQAEKLNDNLKQIMAQFTRIEVALKMKKTGIVPVFYHSDIEISYS
jgi:hypothetical protein